MPDNPRCPQAALSEQVPYTLALRDQPDALKQIVAAAEAQVDASGIFQRQHAALEAFHRPGNRRPNADCVHAKLIAQRGGAYHCVAVCNAHQRPQRKGAFVLHAPLFLLTTIAGNENLLAPNRAVGAVRVLHEIRLVKLLCAYALSALEG